MHLELNFDVELPDMNHCEIRKLSSRQLIATRHRKPKCSTGELLSNFRDIYGIQGFFTQVEKEGEKEGKEENSCACS